MRRLLIGIWLGCVFGCAGRASAQTDRTLDWDALEVRAALDGDGRLHVTETHTIVFDGEWNGVERRFRVEPWQSFEFGGLTEIDAGGERRPCRPGELTAIDEYKFFPDHLLRWRSRLASDPPFAHAVRRYELQYVLSKILLARGDDWTLDFDFAFPDREGEIRDFTATLTLAPAWRPLSDFAATVHASNLPPNEGFVRRIGLHYTGSGQPESVATGVDALRQPASPRAALLTLAIALAVLGALGASFWRKERDSGHLEALVPRAQIDEAWLETQLFRFLPEVVGAAWDRKTAGPEVAALLARLNLEGKLASKVRSGKTEADAVLELELKCSLDQLQDYERTLLEALFLGSTRTDTQRIRTHYAKLGFNPSALIARGLDERVAASFGVPDKLAGWRPAVTICGFLASAALIANMGLQHDIAGPLMAAVCIALGLLFGLARLQATAYRQTVVDMHARGALVAAALSLLLIAIAATNLLAPWPFTQLDWLACALLAASIAWSVYNGLCPLEARETIRRRKQLASARNFLAHELQAPAPRLKDAWAPYLLAFGLGPDVERWTRVHAPGQASSDDWTRSHSSGSSTPWSGGGGAFGGAGASGAWAAAVGGMAAGVAAPSSSDSSSSSSGSSSSGGGGAGGW